MSHGAHVSIESALRLLVQAVAAEVVPQVVRELNATSTPMFATAKDNPLGSARAFLDAARSDRFPSFMKGRERCARWSDVLSYIESRKPRRGARKLHQDECDAVLDEAMARPGRKRSA